MTKKMSGSMKVLSVILGALMGGFMWRCRGDGGWGSSWGLYGVGLVLMLLIYHFYSNRTGMKFEMIPLGAFLLGLGVTGYATVLEQMSGLLWSDLPYSGTLLNGQLPTWFGPHGDAYVPINPVSGGVILWIMGFTLVPFFTVFVTSLFSRKQYGLKDYALVVLIFFAASWIFKATIAHPVLKAINPEQVQYAALGLKNAGYTSTPMSAYLHHFQNRRWTQDIPFFENYYMSVEHIADALAVLVVFAYLLLVRKDKYTAFGSLLLDGLTATSTMAMSPLVYSQRYAFFFPNGNFPGWFLKLSEWGTWEFTTGMFFGLFVMLFLALTADKISPPNGYDDTPLYLNKGINFGVNFVLSLWIFCIAPARIVGIRTARLLEDLQILPDDEPLGTILTVLVAAILGVCTLKLLRKNILQKGSNAVDGLPVDFAKKALPAYLALCFVAYFFLDDVTILHPGKSITIPIMLIASALIALLYIPTRKASN